MSDEPRLIKYIHWNGDYFEIKYHLSDTWETPLDIMLTAKEEEALERRGRVLDKRNVMQYTDDLWMECAMYNERKEERLAAITDERSKILRKYNLRDNRQTRLL